MSWLEHLFEEFSALPAYLFWQKFIEPENLKKKKDDEENDPRQK